MAIQEQSVGTSCQSGSQAGDQAETEVREQSGLRSWEIKQRAESEHRPEGTAKQSGIWLSFVAQTLSVPGQGFIWGSGGYSDLDDQSSVCEWTALLESSGQPG